MDRTHTLNRLKGVIASHGVLLEALAMSAVLGTLVSTSPETPYDAHFMRRPQPVQQVSSSSPPSQLTRREQRLRKRMQKAVVQRTTTVAQRSAPYIALDDLRPAAPQEAAASSAAAAVIAPEITLPSIPASSAQSSSASSATPVPDAGIPVSVPDDSFPAFGRSMHPVSDIPNWGAMSTPQQWNRTYKQMSDDDFVRVPAYDLRMLRTPIEELQKDRFSEETIRVLTAKLYYSTRHFGAYHLDSGEFAAVHPGIDLKLAEGTPVGAVAGGRVHDVRRNEQTLGIHVLIEHRAPDGQTYYSIYGHLQSASVAKGDTVKAGQVIGAIGMTGHTTGPHLHLQVDRGMAGETNHEVYWPESIPSPAEADSRTVSPIYFIRQYADGQ